ncbi:MAG: hypothetical protein ACXWV5_12460, partial [Flavitalea sp.]
TYEKSNWDGSHASTIFLYVSDTNKIESFKWAAGDEWATLVTAQINWKTYSVNDFKNFRIYKNTNRQQLAELYQKDSMLYFKVMDYSDSMKLTHPFWQSYDFDFAGLSFIWRALKNHKESFWIHIADAGMKDNKIAFLNKGTAIIQYLGTDTSDGKLLEKYKIDGPGLQNKGGNIWINPHSKMIELYKIELPDEEGFDNGMLKLIKTEKMKEAEWKNFIDQKMK